MPKRLANIVQGFTLLEAVVAALVLAVGVLGVASLQVASMKSNHAAYMTSQAVNALDELAAMLSSNPSGAAAGNYQFDSSNAAPSDPGYVCNGSDSCTSSELAAWQLFDWYQQLSTQVKLPAVQASAACIAACADGVAYRLSVAWDEGRDGSFDDGVDPALYLVAQP